MVEAALFLAAVRPSAHPSVRLSVRGLSRRLGARHQHDFAPQSETDDERRLFFFFFVGGGEHRPAAWRQRSLARSHPTQTLFLRSRSRFRLRDTIPEEIPFMYTLTFMLSPPLLHPLPPQASERFTRRVKQMARCVPGRRRSLPVSADHVTMKTHRSVTDGFDCFRIHDEDRQSFLSVIFMTTKTIRSDEERERSIIFPRDGGRRVQKTVRLPLFSSSVS